MPRFFFHIRDGDRLDPDPAGMDLTGVDAVRAEAERFARELLQQGGDAFSALVIEVVDEHGALVLTIGLTEAARE